MFNFNIEEIPIIDSHCHPFPIGREKNFEQYWMMSLQAQSNFHSRRTVAFDMVRQELIKLLKLEKDASADEVVAERNRAYSEAPTDYVHTLIQDSGIAGLIVDFGFPIKGKRLTEDELDEFYKRVDGTRVWKINRIETVMNRLLGQKLSSRDFFQKYMTDLEKMINEEGLIALKSVIAYYTGLGIQKHGHNEIEKAYSDYMKDLTDKSAEKILRDEAFLLAVSLCAERDIPLQIHSGMGDAPVCDLRKTNPLLLHDIYNEPVMQKATIVLDHAGYPFVAETGYFVSHFENLYLDLSSMIPHAAHAAEQRLLEVLEMCPWSRIMYGSDGGSIPEHMWLGALYIRKSLERVLGYLTKTGFIEEAESEEIARMILIENAERVYQLKK